MSIADWYPVFIPGGDIQTKHEWCLNNVGKQYGFNPYERRDGIWASFWQSRKRKYEFLFRDEKDAIMFVLRFQ